MRVTPNPIAGFENENDGPLPAQEEALTRFIAIIAALACACAAMPARAELAQFEFSGFFATGSAGSVTVTGSFMGELEEGRIGDLSQVHLFRDGVAFRGNGSLFAFQYDRESGTWVRGGYLTFDGSDNNIMLIDTDYAAGDSGFFNYFYSVTGLGTASFQPSFYRYQVPGTNQLSVREIDLAAPVPEPATWAMLVAGFAALGAAMRRGNGRMARRFTL